jgi:hypothetical protein
MLLRASLTTIAKLVAASSLVLSAATAKAALVTLTFSGTITSGLDKLNLFETSTTDLTGSAYIQTLSFNTDDLNIVWQTPYSYAGGFDNKQIKANGSVSVNHHTYTWTSDIALGSLAFSAQVVHGGGDEFQMRADVYKNIEDNFTSGVYLNSVTSSFVGSADPTQSHTFNGDLSSLRPWVTSPEFMPGAIRISWEIFPKSAIRSVRYLSLPNWHYLPLVWSHLR